MKKLLLSLSPLFFSAAAFAQLRVENGAFIKTVSDIRIILDNMDLVVNGNIDQAAGEGTYIFSGNGDNTFSGTGIPTFDKIVLSKSSGGKLVLNQNFLVASSLAFASGYLDLNNSLLQIKPGGFISGESGTGHIIGSGNGYVYTTTALNAPAAANPGNLGAVISSAADLGVVTIRRRHMAQAVSAGITGIKRYYEIYPANNIGLNATLRLYYSDDELNGLNENTLILWKKTGAWTEEGYTSMSAAENYVEKQGISSFSTWTLASSSGALPVKLAAFQVTGTGPEGISLRWSATSGSNTREFIIERSLRPSNGFTAIGSVPAASAPEGAEYHFTDPAPAKGLTCYYRLKMIDSDDSHALSRIVSAMAPGGALLAVFPNPAVSSATLSSEKGISSVEIFNIAGNRVGSFQYAGRPVEASLDLEPLSPGTYLLRVVDPRGIARTARLVVSR